MKQNFKLKSSNKLNQFKLTYKNNSFILNLFSYTCLLVFSPQNL